MNREGEASLNLFRQLLSEEAWVERSTLRVIARGPQAPQRRIRWAGECAACAENRRGIPKALQEVVTNLAIAIENTCTGAGCENPSSSSGRKRTSLDSASSYSNNSGLNSSNDKCTVTLHPARGTALPPG